MTPEDSKKFLAMRDSLFQTRGEMLLTAGFRPCEYNAQWVSPSGERHWEDAALRVAESFALEALGQDFRRGRMP